MVLYKKRALNDLKRLFKGLLEWSVKTNTKDEIRENHLSETHVIEYYNRLIDECDSIDSLTYHSYAKFFDHIRFGKYVHNFATNRRTNIYIIYDINADGVVLIKKITTNYKTVS
jgi:hypothetical protein